MFPIQSKCIFISTFRKRELKLDCYWIQRHLLILWNALNQTTNFMHIASQLLVKFFTMQISGTRIKIDSVFFMVLFVGQLELNLSTLLYIIMNLHAYLNYFKTFSFWFWFLWFIWFVKSIETNIKRRLRMTTHVSLSKSEEYKNHSVKQLICYLSSLSLHIKEKWNLVQSITDRVICQYDVFSIF